jgi:hypothetical protein
MAKLQLNSDSYQIKNYELTPEGYLKFWMVGGIPGQELLYDGGRKEIINKDALFNEDSLSTAVGKPVSLNHPPRPINAKNYREYSKGSLLQEYSEDENGALVFAGIVHDDAIVQAIMKGEITHVSASYLAEKKANDDGILEQTNRKYNHIALLTKEFSPRAGENSKIIILDDTPPQADSDDTENKKEKPVNNIDAMEIQERVELLTDWREVLEKNSIAIDYNADSNAIKRQILGIYYPEKTIKALNNDAILQGFWLNFISNPQPEITKNDDGSESGFNFDYSRKNQNSPHGSMNFDSDVEAIRNKYIAKMEGKY